MSRSSAAVAGLHRPSRPTLLSPTAKFAQSKHANAKNNDNETRPRNQTFCSKAECVPSLGPIVGSIDRRIPIDVSPVLIGKAVNPKPLSLAALRIYPPLLAHESGATFQVVPDNVIFHRGETRFF